MDDVIDVASRQSCQVQDVEREIVEDRDSVLVHEVNQVEGELDVLTRVEDVGVLVVAELYESNVVEVIETRGLGVDSDRFVI